MADVEAVLEFAVELTHFYNVDLYVGGYYQIRTLLKAPKKQQCKTEVSIPRSAAPHLFPASVVNGRAVGTTFEILYRDEDIQLSDVIEFRVFLPLKLMKMPKVLSFTLIIELWYIDKEEMVKKAADDVFAAFECVSKRFVTLNMPIYRGLHCHRPILFDYFHLCGLTFTVHASLVGLNKPPAKLEKLTKSKEIVTQSSQLAASSSAPVLSQSSPKPSGAPVFYLPFEEAIFGSTSKSSQSRLQCSFQYHRNACWLLLTAYEALELKLTQLLSCLPTRYQIRIQSVDCAKKFEVLQQNIQRLGEENEILLAIENTMTLLSAELSLLWNQFLDLFRSQQTIAAHLAKEHHLSRVRRFAESFFSSEGSMLALLISGVGHSLKLQEKIVDSLRKSTYFQRPLALAAFCEDSDGTPEIMPIVFEERFYPVINRSNLHYAPNTLEESFAEGESASEGKLASKDFLSLDLINVNKPAMSLQDTATKSLLNRAQSDGKKSIRKKLFSRSSSVKLWRKAGKLLTFPLSNVELVKFESKFDNRKFASDVTDCCTRMNPLFGSMPNLKCYSTHIAATMDHTSLDQINLELSETSRKTDSDPFLSLSQHKSELESVLASCDAEHNDKISLLPVELSINNESDLPCSNVSKELTGKLLSADVITSPSQLPSCEEAKPRLTSGVEQDILSFVAAKEEFKEQMRQCRFDGHLCSDFTGYPARVPYFEQWADRDFDDESTNYHLVVCVHGLDGTSADLRMVRAYIELGLSNVNVKFLMSKRNQVNTFDDFDTMTKNLVDEILLHFSQCTVQPKRISFIGHSLGNIIIRSALGDPRLEPWLEHLHTFLSLNGPHCGILYNNNSVVNMGIRLVQRWKKSISLQQLALKDSADLRDCFLFKLSQKPCLQYFKNVLLVGSHEDYYVPIHSALMQVCKAAVKDNSSLGAIYTEMVRNLMEPLVNSGKTTVVRYSVFHSLQSSSATSQLLGRAAHIAVLDSDLFIEKLMSISALRYFE